MSISQAESLVRNGLGKMGHGGAWEAVYEYGGQRWKSRDGQLHLQSISPTAAREATVRREDTRET